MLEGITSCSYVTSLAQVNEAGSHIVAAESGDLLYWDMATRQEMLVWWLTWLTWCLLRKVVYQEKQENIQQIFFYKSQARCVVISKKGKKGGSLTPSSCPVRQTCILFLSIFIRILVPIPIFILPGSTLGLCVSRSVPDGTKQWEFEFPFVTFIKVWPNRE